MRDRCSDVESGRENENLFSNKLSKRRAKKSSAGTISLTIIVEVTESS